MGRVQVLPEDLINKIAAGEVVDRPSSAIKELVENAIDAGAERIEVEAEEGGRQLLRVVDDGCGMSAEDALLAIQRHATSKIRTEDDLFAIRTMGFRGEALPSIAAVSRFLLQTRIASEEAGIQIAIEGGKPPVITPIGKPVGTTIEVRDLFFNVPARRKFLKSDGTESNVITDILRRYALAYPERRFRYSHNRRIQFNLAAASDLRERSIGVFGRLIGEGLYPFSFEEGWLKIHGLFSKPDLTCQQATQSLYFFVNHRYIRSRALAGTCQEAYRGAIEKGRYPYVLLFLEVDPAEVDINVHPQKIEARFQREVELQGRVLATLRHALSLTPWAKKASSTAQTSALTTPTASPEEPTSSAPPTTAFPPASHDRLGPTSSATAARPGSIPTSQPPGLSAHLGAPPPFGPLPTSDTPLPDSLPPGSPPAPHLSQSAPAPSPTRNLAPEAPTNFASFRQRFLDTKEKGQEAQTKVPLALAPLPPSQEALGFLEGWDAPSTATPAPREKDAPPQRTADHALASGLSTFAEPSTDRRSLALSSTDPALTQAASASTQAASAAHPPLADAVAAPPALQATSLAGRPEEQGFPLESAVAGELPLPETQGFFSSLRYIGQFSQMYLIFETSSSGHLLLLDQHAAHERINYQKLLDAWNGSSIPQERFLFPKRIELGIVAAQQAELYHEELERLGISLEPFGGQSFALKAVPFVLKDADPLNLISDILGELAAGRKASVVTDKIDSLLMKMACHRSIRGDHRMTLEEVRSLMKQLDAAAFRGHCPHGRPIYFEITRSEIEKRFHRS